MGDIVWRRRANRAGQARCSLKLHGRKPGSNNHGDKTLHNSGERGEVLGRRRDGLMAPPAEERQMPSFLPGRASQPPSGFCDGKHGDTVKFEITGRPRS